MKPSENKPKPGQWWWVECGGLVAMELSHDGDWVCIGYRLAPEGVTPISRIPGPKELASMRRLATIGTVARHDALNRAAAKKEPRCGASDLQPSDSGAAGGTAEGTVSPEGQEGKGGMSAFPAEESLAYCHEVARRMFKRLHKQFGVPGLAEAIHRRVELIAKSQNELLDEMALGALQCLREGDPMPTVVHCPSRGLHWIELGGRPFAGLCVVTNVQAGTVRAAVLDEVWPDRESHGDQE